MDTLLPSLLSLGPLVGKVKEYQVETIVDALCANMRSDKEQLRDIAGIGLKTVLSELPPAATGTQVPGIRHCCYLSYIMIKETGAQRGEGTY